MNQTMNDMCTYVIQIRGQVGEDEVNHIAPLYVKVIRVDTDATLLTVCTDQAGLVGLIRHLHNRGFILLSVHCEPCFQEGA